MILDAKFDEMIAVEFGFIYRGFLLMYVVSIIIVQYFLIYLLDMTIFLVIFYANGYEIVYTRIHGGNYCLIFILLNINYTPHIPSNRQKC